MTLYVHWKYEHKIDLDLVPLGLDPTIEWDDFEEQTLDHEISELIRLCENVHYVWEHTGIDSKLRTFVLDSCASRAYLGMSDKELYPSDFFVELACRQMELRDRTSSEYYPTVVGRCLYHEHEGSTADAHGQHLQCVKRERNLQMRAQARKPASTNAVVESAPVKKRKRDSEQQ
ncbi:hypothetical protein LTR10_011086 [Elasticomyces elasticus]|nr:hypothetical protein LTR10_011086 [Elasticomyces elasticus]KAK4966490.1 hypothetical protein LTR42_011655 [Elasticomyces elasticus]